MSELREPSLREALARLETSGVLLMQDKRLPCVVEIITGASLSGSWWSHPKAREIYRVLTLLEEHPDILFVKLVGGKVTLLHRRLWPALVSVAVAGEPWQRRGLSREARTLLAKLRPRESVSASGAAARELQQRLLVHATEVHTESGAHKLLLEPWEVWAERAGVKKRLDSSEGKRILEHAASSIGAQAGALPWNRRRTRTAG